MLQHLSESALELAQASEDVQVGAADTGGGDGDAQLMLAGFRQRPLDQPKRGARRIELHGVHRRHGLLSRICSAAPSASAGDPPAGTPCQPARSPRS